METILGFLILFYINQFKHNIQQIIDNLIKINIYNIYFYIINIILEYKYYISYKLYMHNYNNNLLNKNR